VGADVLEVGLGEQRLERGGGGRVVEIAEDDDVLFALATSRS
jgi:hypothetical protein